MNNAIYGIKPYQGNGMRGFDDHRVGLDKEPFVAGAVAMIDMAVRLKGIANAGDGFVLVFSSMPFPRPDRRP